MWKEDKNIYKRCFIKFTHHCFRLKNRKHFMHFGRLKQRHYGSLKKLKFSSQCKLQKCEIVKMVLSCACILFVCIVFLYKVTLPTIGLACVIQHFKTFMSIRMNGDRFDKVIFYIDPFSVSKHCDVFLWSGLRWRPKIPLTTSTMLAVKFVRFFLTMTGENPILPEYVRSLTVQDLDCYLNKLILTDETRLAYPTI